MKLSILLSSLFLIASCKQEPTAVAESESESELEACCEDEAAPAATATSAESIYQLESKWTDDQGKEQTLADLGGNVRILTMGYSTCKFACPRLLADMRLIEEKLTPELRDKVRFTFISIDPEVDTPARLAEYRSENKIDPEHWTLLTGATDSVQELAVVMGVQYRKIGDADFAHSNIISVLNSRGEIVHRQEGLTVDPAETLKAIAAAK